MDQQAFRREQMLASGLLRMPDEYRAPPKDQRPQAGATNGAPKPAEAPQRAAIPAGSPTRG
jgi:hypothetical protein